MKFPVLIYKVLIYLLLVSCFVLMTEYQSRGEDLAHTEQYDNVLLITLDTTRSDHLGCYGYKSNTSPHIDEIALESVLFSDAVTVIPLTTPSHASIMTGLRPESHQVYRNSYPVHSQFTMLAEILKSEGYVTGGFVSVKLIGSRVGFSQGFDVFSDVAAGKTGGEQGGEGEQQRKRIFPFPSLKFVQRSGDETVDIALDWIRDNASRKFFAWVHLYDPHLSYTPPIEYGLRFNREYETYLKKIRNPLYKAQDYADQVEFDNGNSDEGKKTFVEHLVRAIGLDVQEFINPNRFPEYLVADLIAAYDGEIAFVDDQANRILDLLKDEGVYGSTIVIIIGDHGEILYEKEEYFGHHKYLYEGSMRIPLIMRIPGIAPKVIDERITNVDILPTLIEALNIESKVAMDGMSYWPLIKDGNMMKKKDHFIYVTHIGKQHKQKKQESSIPFINQICKFFKKIVRMCKRVILKIFGRSERWKVTDYFEKYAVVKNEWKLIQSNVKDKKKKTQYELYNIEVDPEELHNLVERNREVFKELKKALDLYIHKKRFRVAPSPFEGQSESQSQEEIKTLRSLGYM